MNLLANIPSSLDRELIEILAQGKQCRIERIVSMGQTSPPGFWYDQTEDEWVAVLQGHARLSLQEPEESVELFAGDHLLIKAHRKHRVEATSAEPATVWLAVFFE